MDAADRDESRGGDAVRHAVIAGSGRSGTSWLGHLLGRHPGVVYKYEPFRPTKVGNYRPWLDLIGAAPDDVVRAEFDRQVRRAVVDIDRPPFDADRYRLPPVAMRQLYRVATRVGPLRRWYPRLVSFDVRPDDRLLVKDVSLATPLLRRVVTALDAAPVIIVRNPLATVASFLRGVELGAFDSDLAGPRRRVRAELADHDGFADPTGAVDRIDRLSAPALYALRWRLEAEATATVAADHARGVLVVYDDLVRRTDAELRRIHRQLGWPHHPVGASGDGGEGGADEGGAAAGPGGFFSLHRDPQAGLHGWRRHLGADVHGEVAEIIAPSPLLHLWPEADLALAP